MPPEQQLNENIWPALGFMPITLQLMSSCLGIIFTNMNLPLSVASTLATYIDPELQKTGGEQWLYSQEQTVPPYP